MSEKSTNPWIIVLLVSVAVNGLLGGLLFSKHIGPKPSALHMNTPRFSPIPPPALVSVGDNPRQLLRHLEPTRRKEVLSRAMKQLRSGTPKQSHDLLFRLRKSRKHTIALLRADTLNAEALHTELAKNRDLKDTLGRQGDMLILEIFKQLTPEERQGLAHNKKRKYKKRKLKHKN